MFTWFSPCSRSPVKVTLSSTMEPEVKCTGPEPELASCARKVTCVGSFHFLPQEARARMQMINEVFKTDFIGAEQFFMDLYYTDEDTLKRVGIRRESFVARPWPFSR